MNNQQYPLPEGWEWKPLSSLATIVSGGTPSREVPDFWEPPLHAWVTPTDITGKSGRFLFDAKERISDVGLSNSSATMLPIGTILMTSRATLGEAKIARIPCCTNQGFKSLVPKSDVPSEYLYYLLQLFKEKYQKLGIGSTFLEVNKKDTEKFLLPVAPPSLRPKIANILCELDDHIDSTLELIGKYEVTKQGLMADLFSRGIDTATGQLRPSVHDAPELYQETSIGLLPKEWEVCPLGSISSIASGITLGKDLSKMTTVRVPYLRVANVQDGYLDLTEVKFVDVPEAEATKYLLLYGDVLMNEGGDFDKLGRGAVWRNEVEGCCHQNHVFRVRTVQAELRPEFLAYWSASTYGKRYFILNSKQSTNLASINSTQLKAFPVAKPSVDEQSAIEDRLQSIDRMIDMCQLDVDKLKQQKSGLMRDLLTGKLPVNA
ncbi:restriction endonuclease subunit S [Aeromonas veronii]|uniref:restriction endonuclease subunit S n=1 Tax=Aeromonas veronii TaxID=654 RepID=UPI0038D316F5